MCINAWLYIHVHGHACIHTYICILARQASLHGLCIIKWMIELVVHFSPVSLQSCTIFQNRKLRRVMELRRRAQVVQIQMKQVLTGLSWIMQLLDIVMTNNVRTVGRGDRGRRGLLEVTRACALLPVLGQPIWCVLTAQEAARISVKGKEDAGHQTTWPLRTAFPG